MDALLTLGRCVAIPRGTDEIRRATAYLSPRLVIKATRLHRRDRRQQSETFVVTIGAPNYRERAFVKDAKRAGERFPVRKLQLTHWPQRRNSR